MSLSDELYTDALHFQNERKAIVDKYEATLKDLENKKGSVYYTEQRKKAEAEKTAALNDTTDKYRGFIVNDLKRMKETNSKRGVAAPSEEEIRIITALKAREKVSDRELELIANSVRDNALCLAVVGEVAQKQGYMRNFSSLYEGTDYPVETTDATIDSIDHEIADFLKYDTKDAARIAAEYDARMHGIKIDYSELPKRDLFDSKEAFYSQMGGLKGNNLKLFCAAVDGTEKTTEA